VLAFVESGVADFPETLQVADQSAYIGPRDLVRGAVEMLGTEGSEARQDRIDFALAGDECCNDFAVIWGLFASGWLRPGEAILLCTDTKPSGLADHFIAYRSARACTYSGEQSRHRLTILEA
jgi:hypothetical protein